MRARAFALLLFSGLTQSSTARAEACSQAVPKSIIEFQSKDSPEETQKSAEDACRQLNAKWSGQVSFGSDGSVRALSCTGERGPEGPTASWHPNGKLRSRGQMEAADSGSALCGEWTRYFENGEVQDQGQWMSGQPVGKWKVRSRSDAVFEEKEFAQPFRRHWEFSFFLGGNLGIDVSNFDPQGAAPSTPRVTPGASVNARMGYRWTQALVTEGILGFNLIRFGRSVPSAASFGAETSVTQTYLTPYVALAVYWNLPLQGLRLGVKPGVALAIPVRTDPFMSNQTSELRPLLLVSAQVFGKFFGPTQFVVDVSSAPPPIRNFFDNWFGEATVGLRF